MIQKEKMKKNEMNQDIKEQGNTFNFLVQSDIFYF